MKDRKLLSKRILAVLISAAMIVTLMPGAFYAYAEECDHEYGDWVIEYEPDCYSSGLKSKTCSKCYDYIEEEIPATGHNYGDWTVREKPTCEYEGTKVRICSYCGDEEYEYIPMINHTYGDWVIKGKPGCDYEGYKIKTCSKCGDEQYEDIPATGHKWSSWAVDDAATCTEKGYKIRTCSKCEDVEYAEIPAKGHSWSSSYTVDVKATCTKTGRKSIHCTRCNAKKSGSAKTVAKLSHKFSSWKTSKAATEIAAGTQTRKCSLCGKTETKTIAALAPTLPATTIKKPKAAKKAFTVKWTKVAKKNLKKIGSIQIQYSTDKNFKKGVKTISASKKAKSKKIKKLKAKTTYYVRIRTYKKAGGKVHVSKWSAVKAVRVK